MKLHILCIIAIALTSALHSQCPTSAFLPHIELKSQSAVDNFATNWPDCTDLPGGIIINGAIDDLSGLSIISSLGDYLHILNTNLSSLDGLQNISSISGSLIIENNDQLENTDALRNVDASLDINLIIRNNPKLTQIDFESINRVNRDIIIDQNEELSVVRLNGLESTGRDIYIGESNSLSEFTMLKLDTIRGSLLSGFNSESYELFSFPQLQYVGENFDLNHSSALNLVLPLIDHVGGDLRIHLYNLLQPLNELSYIGGDFPALGIPVSGFNGFSSLDSIGGDFIIKDQSSLVNMTGLENLKVVGGDLIINNTRNLERLEGLEHLKQVRGSLTIGSNLFLNTSLTDVESLIALERVGDQLSITGNPLIRSIEGLNKLEYIGSQLLISGRSHLDSITGFQSLKSIDGNLIVYVEQDISGFCALKNIGGQLQIHGKRTLSNLSGFKNLRTIGNNFELTEIATSDLSGFESLENIGSRFVVKSSRGLRTLQGLTQLSKIGGDLLINANLDLISLSGLETLASINGTLDITGNRDLNGLNGLAQLNHISITQLNIFNNPELVACEQNVICNYINNSSSYDIRNNATGCNSISEIQSTCSIALNRIKGTIAFDSSGDGCGNSDDLSVVGYPVRIADESQEALVFTQASGSFNYYTDAGDIELYPILSNPNFPYFSIDPETEQVSFNGLGEERTITFCLKKTQELADAAIQIIPLGDIRPGFETSFKIVISNNGTLPINGSYELRFDSDLMQPVLISDSPDINEMNRFVWDYEDLNPFESRSNELRFLFAAPPSLNIRDTIRLEGLIEHGISEGNISDNQQTIRIEVIGSFDPNDKTVLQGFKVPIEKKDEHLSYLIRFQNTGTAEAIHVRLEDQLEEQLDLATLQPIAQSHYCEYSLDPDSRKLIIEFPNIYLPDSLSAPQKSQGFALFRINPVSSIVTGNEINNKAEIYFDFNPPIITNEVTTIYTDLVNDLPVHLDLNSIVLSPNPLSDNQLRIHTQLSIDHVALFDLSGCVIEEFHGKSLQEVLITKPIISGIYLIRMTTNSGKIIQKKIHFQK